MISTLFQSEWNQRGQLEGVDKFVNGLGIAQECWIVNPFSIPLAHESLRSEERIPPEGAMRRDSRRRRLSCFRIGIR